MSRSAAVFGLALVLVASACGSGHSGSPEPQAPSLDGTRWLMTGVAGKAAQPGGLLDLKSGRMSGSTGCNHFGGTYRQTGSALSLELGPVTAMGCPALKAQEATVLASLPKVARAAEQGGKLLLLDSNRDVRLTYTPEPPAMLEGPTWQVTAFNDGTGAMTRVADGSSITATFARDTGGEGSLTGSSGCNTYTTSYNLRGRTLAVAAPVTTRKTCAQPAGVMEQERAFIAALVRAATVEPAIDGGITIVGADGDIQVTLTPAG